MTIHISYNYKGYIQKMSTPSARHKETEYPGPLKAEAVLTQSGLNGQDRMSSIRLGPKEYENSVKVEGWFVTLLVDQGTELPAFKGTFFL